MTPIGAGDPPSRFRSTAGLVRGRREAGGPRRNSARAQPEQRPAEAQHEGPRRWSGEGFV